jgi:WD40 repeat protein
MEIGLVDLATRQERALIREPGEISDLEWSPNGAAILFISDRNGQPRLWRVPTAAGAASPVPSLVALVSDPIRSFSLSDRGELAYVCLTGNSSQIGLIPLPEGPLDSLFHRREGREYLPCAIGSRNSTYAPTFSPDGSQIAFISTESNAEEIWVANADCTNYRQLTFLSQSGLDRLAWSGDGTRIAFDQRIDGQFDLFYLDLGNGQIHRLSDSAEDEFSPVWSAKSDSIYYSWRRNGTESGTGQIRQWVLASNQTELLVEGGDGRFLALASPEQIFFTRRDLIWRKNLRTGEEKQLASLDQVLKGVSWEIAGNQVYLITRKNQSLPVLFRRDLLSGRTQKVLELDLPLSYSNPGFAISPNGRAIASASVSACAKEIRFLKYLD